MHHYFLKKSFEIKQIDIVENRHIIGMKLRARNSNFCMVGIYNKTACHENVSFNLKVEIAGHHLKNMISQIKAIFLETRQHTTELIQYQDKI